MTKGIVYLVWGNYNKDLLKRSIRSANENSYNAFVIEDDTNFLNFQKRQSLFDLSPFDQTLYLDIDTIIKGDLSFGFDMAQKFGIACCIAPASSAYIVKESVPIRHIMPKDLPQYNCGVIFFDKLKASKTFKRYSHLLRINIESSSNDQPFFSQAIYETINPYILPPNWNFRHHLSYAPKALHGSVKIVHSKQDYNK